jgi:hypothetical protein
VIGVHDTAAHTTLAVHWSALLQRVSSDASARDLVMLLVEKRAFASARHVQVRVMRM